MISSEEDEDLFMEYSREDLNDSEQISKYFQQSKCCSLQCNKIFLKDTLLKHRYAFLEMKKCEQDLMILSQLQSGRRSKEMESSYAKQVTRKKSRFASEMQGMARQLVQHCFCNLPICQQTFFFIHPVGQKRYKNLCKHFDEHGVVIRKHGLRNRTPNRANVFSVETTERVVSFIRNYAEKFALCLPGRQSNIKDYRSLQLPTSTTKVELYRKYEHAANDEGDAIIVGESSFYKLWGKYCSNILTLKPKSDLCDTCR